MDLNLPLVGQRGDVASVRGTEHKSGPDGAGAERRRGKRGTRWQWDRTLILAALQTVAIASA